MQSTWATQQLPDLGPCNIIRPKPGYYPREDPQPPGPPAPVPFAAPAPQFQTDDQNFAMWLLDPGAPYTEFSVSSVPFADGGLESAFNNNIQYDYESLTSGRSQLETPRAFGEGEELLSETRRRQILHYYRQFLDKNPKLKPLVANIHDDGGDIPALSVDMMRDCLQEFWDRVSPRLPIVHQPTFDCNRCSIFLVMVMVALGAVSLRTRDMTGNLGDYGGFADVIVWGARGEILGSEEATPPVSLWVSQSLLLLEFYEKMYSSRRLHERAHIYHGVALNLLRRGNPLIGRAGSESPPEMPSSDAYAWWCRWANTESMHRVVFAAFMMDIIHAAMFGHAADMAPHEIRLPLPCDDNLWTASNPDTVRQLDHNLRMYGIKQVFFLDGLKRAFHGKEVKTHTFGRMILMSGLLSVGWHLTRREAYLKGLDLSAPSAETQETWRKTLLNAFDEWKQSFDAAQGTAVSPSLATASLQIPGANGPVRSASVLYHLAHLSLNVDIIDCQVYAGARRLLGRKVSTRDYANVVARMKSWATLPSTRHAILHAFKLLHRVLVDPRWSIPDDSGRISATGNMTLPPINGTLYSCRNELDPHRPWIMYYAALAIWSFVRALNHKESSQDPVEQQQVPPGFPQSKAPPPPVDHRRVAVYLAGVSNLPELTESAATELRDGLPDLLDALRSFFWEAHSELLQEAQERLRVCKEILATST